MSESMIKALADKHYMSAAYSKDDIESVVRDVWQAALSQQGEAVAWYKPAAFINDQAGMAIGTDDPDIAWRTSVQTQAPGPNWIPLYLSPAPKPQGEPVAWWSKQYGFVFMHLQPHEFAVGSTLYMRDGRPAWRIESKCSKTALLNTAELPHGAVFYAAPPAPAADELAGLREQLAAEQKAHAMTRLCAREEARLADERGAALTELREKLAALSAPSNAAPASDVAPERVSAEDFVEHRHPEYGVGFFCTPDVMDRILATPAAESVPELETLRKWVAQWHAAADKMALFLGLPAGLGASEMVEALREKLSAESVAQEVARSRIQAALANKDHCDKYGWIHLSVNDAKALLSPSPTPAADTERGFVSVPVEKLRRWEQLAEGHYSTSIRDEVRVLITGGGQTSEALDEIGAGHLASIRANELETKLKEAQAALADRDARMRWIPVSERLPEPGKKVLITYLNCQGNRRTVCGYHAPAKYFEAHSDSEIAEYDEATDNYYDPAGWYECIDNWDDYSHIVVHEGEPTHWHEIPAAPTSGEGETK